MGEQGLEGRHQVRYGYGRRIEGVGFDQVLERLTAALAAEGFGVLADIDVQGALKKKLGIEDFRRYRILGACNPQLAHKGVSGEPQLGLLLPCNLVVQESEDRSAVLVSIADPKVLFTLVDNPEIASVAEEADARLRRALAAL